MTRPHLASLFIAFLASSSPLRAAKLKAVSIQDHSYLKVHILDGQVEIIESRARDAGAKKDKVHLFGSPLNTEEAVRPGNWTISSSDDPGYGGQGQHPLACYRKTKVNGQSEQGWNGQDFNYQYTQEHFLYLKLPRPLKRGSSYRVSIAQSLGTDRRVSHVSFHLTRSRSDAIHINLVGYRRGTRIKAADLYSWMGDGGPRDYSSFEGRPVYLYNLRSKAMSKVGQVKFWQKAGKDIDQFDLTRSPVWTVDIERPVGPDTYRLVVDGVGSSRSFTIGPKVYRDPFKVAVLGYYFMRIGAQPEPGIQGTPRQPRYIPGKDPKESKIYLTTMHRWHPKWRKFADGDPWDQPERWQPFTKRGGGLNKKAWGGHSDAKDWDRHLAHVSNIYDMLLPYILTQGALDDDDLGIPESGNGIPDLVDEARYEVDFWLRLRDGQGYSGGLTGPTKDHRMFQSAATAMAAWANAANAAMLAESFRLGSDEPLMNRYLKEARQAYAHASSLRNKMLDQKMDELRGRDLKITAAAFLFNLTGDPRYHHAIHRERRALQDSPGQIWAYAAYLKSPQKLDRKLATTMRADLLSYAKKTETSLSRRRPSRRANRQNTGWFRTAHNVQFSLVAHSISRLPTERAEFLRAITLEADYGLGRNPLNMIQMTTATTDLAHLNSVPLAYTSGLKDGVAGVHPGHTPYMNLYDWGTPMTMGRPSELTKRCYPGDFLNTWPHGEGYFSTPYVYAHNEFTPRQTMRGKLALYAYLYGLDRL